MPPRGRTPSRPPRRRPKVAGHGQPRPVIPATEPPDRAELARRRQAEALDHSERPAADTVEHPAAEPSAKRPAEPAELPAPTPTGEPVPLPAAEPVEPAEGTAATETTKPRPGPRPSRPGGRIATQRRPQRRPRTGATRPVGRSGWPQIVLLVLVIVLLGTLAAVFRGQAERAATGAANNRAVIDTGVSSEVIGQVSKAIETVLSYDHTKLDENERAAREVITGKYVDEYNVTFADIRKTATEQKVTLSTTVLLAGVKHLGTDRAEVIATMDLSSTRNGTPANAPGRVRVVANRIDGRWKIAEMTLL